MTLKLKKSIVFIDLETTGLNISSDRIIEIGMIKINPNQTEEKYTKRVNPQIPISKESSEITGIKDEDLKNEPTFKELAKEILDFIGEADLAGYNSNKFDIPLLLEEFARNEQDFDMENRKCIDVQNIFHKMEQRTLAAAYKFYCDKEIDNAHNAEADIIATYEVLKAQLEKYPELENDVNFLADFSQNSKNKLLDFAGRLALNENNEPIYNFGKHKNKTIKEVLAAEPGYHHWMLNNDFPFYTKSVLKKEIEKLNENTKKTKKPVHSKKKEENNPVDLSDKINQLKNKFNN